jgi:hypothetical protein
MALTIKLCLNIIKIVIVFSLGIISNDLFSQESKPNDRWFIQLHFFTGYTFGEDKSGLGYGVGIRCLYDFERKFLGAPLFLGMETSFLSPLGFEHFKNESYYNRKNYFIVSPVLEQNYKWLKYGFHIGTGIGYYIGMQDNYMNSIGMITNIGWFPVYEGRPVTPYVTYRNDWVFDKNKTNMQSISLGLNF